MINTLNIDITPDKSLIQKLGLTGYRTEQAIAELIDNAIDARIEGQTEIIKVHLDFANHRITVSDNGTGMSKKELQDAMTIAKGVKTEGKLGKFGIGMKSACSTLGKQFTIRTSKIGFTKEYVIDYDEDRWLSDQSLTWKNFEVREIETNSKDNGHGTEITISQLKVPLYPNQVSNFKNSFGIRYGPYLAQRQIQLRINTTVCEPESPRLQKGTRTEVNIKLPSGHYIKGWIGLLQKRSIKGNYGIHLFKYGRLIKMYEKFGFRAHPETAKIMGELHLDHVPVNFHKTEFIIDSPEYIEAEATFRNHDIVKQMIKRSAESTASLLTMNSLVDYFAGRTSTGYLETKLSGENAKKILEQAKDQEIELDNTPILFSFHEKGDSLYSIETVNNRLTISVNKSHEAFKYVKNPLFLLGIIAIEAQLIAKNPQIYYEFIAPRNAKWSTFVKDWSRREVKKREREVSAPTIPSYGLVDDLIALHEILKEGYEYKFQFTGLSTLSRFMHNALGKIVYTIHTTPGAGRYLTEFLTDNMANDFTVLHDPTPTELNIAMDVSEKNRFLVVREYSEIVGSTWASPEKAWIDLLIEIRTNKIPVLDTELKNILGGLIRYGLVNIDKIKSLARHQKRFQEVNDILRQVS